MAGEKYLSVENSQSGSALKTFTYFFANVGSLLHPPFSPLPMSAPDSLEQLGQPVTRSFNILGEENFFSTVSDCANFSRVSWFGSDEARGDGKVAAPYPAKS
jgi:hypothetical protein